MKKLSMLCILTFMLTLSSCWFNWNVDDGTIEPRQSAYKPIVMHRNDVESSVRLSSSEAILQSGKIYVKGDYLFINEPNKGFHIIDNNNPENPQRIKFLHALGSTDMETKSNIIYINQATDLIAVEWNPSDLTINVTKRIRDVFPEKASPDNFYYFPQGDSIVVDWQPINP